MGEAEEEFARAEALLAQLEAGDSSAPIAPPVPSTPSVEEVPNLEENVISEIDFDALPTQERQETFRLGSYYKLSPSLMDNSVLANPDINRDRPGQSNGDVLPFRASSGRVAADQFSMNGMFVVRIKDKTKTTITIQVGTPASISEPYLRSITHGFLPFTVTCKLDEFTSRIPVERALLPDRRGLIFTSADADIVNTLYSDAVAALKREKEEAERKKKEMTTSYDDKMEAIATMAEEIYPGDVELYDGLSNFHVNLRNNVSHNLDRAKYLLIRYPELTISNTKGRSHEIKDLFVLIILGERNGRFCSYGHLFGARAQQTSMEFNSGYRHSHLGSGNNRRLSTFCLGGSSSIAIAVTELSSNFTLEKFELLLYQLSTYVRHESIEGGPYIRMENIRARANRNGRSVNVQSEYNTYITTMAESKLPLPVKVEKVFGKERFVFDTNDITYIQLVGNGTAVPYIKDVNGTLMEEATDSGVNMSAQEKADLEQNMFQFRGETIVYKVIDQQDNAVIQETQKYPSPNLSKYIKGEIEKELNLFYILKENYELN